MYDHKVEIEKLEDLEHKQESDVASALESEDIGSDQLIEPMLHALDAGVDAPAADAKPAWAENLELANHFTDSAAEELVKHVHDLMADDVAVMMHEHAVEAEDDDVEYEGMIPDFFADTAQGLDAEDKKGKLDDTMLVSSSNRRFLEDDDPWNGGGGGGGGGTGGPNDPPPGAGDDAPPEDPKAKKVEADAKKPTKPDPKPAPKPPENKPTPRRDDKGGGGKS
jgi:hypothetical protein